MGSMCEFAFALVWAETVLDELFAQLAFLFVLAKRLTGFGLVVARGLGLHGRCWGKRRFVKRLKLSGEGEIGLKMNGSKV